jgi:hypothetical protein
MPLTDVAIRNAKPRDKPYKVGDTLGLFLLVQRRLRGWRSEQACALVLGSNSAPVSNGTADTATKTDVA